MSDFKATMHQIRFWLGLPPQTPLGKFTALPRPLAGFEGPASKGGRRKRAGEEREGEGGQRIGGLSFW